MIPKWLVALSVFANKITFGPKGYSLCARFYRWKVKGYFIGDVLVFISDKLFWFDDQHCRKAFLLRNR